MNAYYTPTGNPGDLTRGLASQVRDELILLEEGFDKLPSPATLIGGLANYAVDSGAVNALVITVSPSVNAYLDGLTFLIKVAASNTGAATLNVNGLGTKTIVRADGTALAAGDFVAGQIIQASYDLTNTRFQLNAVAAAPATVRSALLTGLNAAFATDITAADTVLSAFGKTQGKFSAIYANTGSALLGFIHDGAGAVGTTVQAAIRANPINVKTFGLALDGVTDDTTKWGQVIAEALASGRDLYWPGGDSYVTDKVSLSAGVTLLGAHRCSCSFIIDSGFNMAATGVLNPSDFEPGAGVFDIGFKFAQPLGAVNRAGLIHYPPAIQTGAARFVIDRIRIEDAWDGIDARGNTGGCNIGFVEVCAFNKAFQQDGALDFSHGGHWHFWPFGQTTGTPNLLAIYTDGTTIGAEIGRSDGLTVDSISLLSSKLVITANASNLAPMFFGRVQLDGNGARITQVNGLVGIAQCYDGGKDSSAVDPTIAVTGGALIVDQFFSVTSAASQTVWMSGGDVTINGGRVTVNNAGYSLFLATGGRLALRNIYFNPFVLAYTQPHVNVSTTAILQMSGCTWPTKGGSTGTAVSVTNDSQLHSVTGNNFADWTYTTPVGAVYAVYGPNAGQTSTVPYGGTGLTTLATGRIPYGNGTGAFQSSANLAFSGTVLSIASGTNTNALTVSSTGSVKTVTLSDTGASGCALQIVGNGGVTPSKYIRVFNADFAVLSDAYGTLLNLTDAGVLTLASDLGTTGSRITKGWFTDLTVTNAIAGSITGNAATVTTNANLTGVITSVGNATSIASQTGTGTRFVVDNTPTITSPVISTGLTASGSASNTFAGSTGTFITSTGANTLSGATTINDATTPSLTTAAGKTNTGFVQVNGKTSGAIKIMPVDAAAQTVTLSLAAQTTGAATLTIPDLTGASRTLPFLERANTWTASQAFGVISASSGGASAAGTFVSSGSTITASLTDTGAAGCGMQITGNGATTPSKFLRVFSGSFDVLNSAGAASILNLTDAGAMAIPGGLTAFNGVAVGSGANSQFFVKASSTANLGFYYGTGAPGFSAGKGSLYVRTDATTTTTRLYINSDGASTWTTFTSAA